MTSENFNSYWTEWSKMELANYKTQNTDGVLYKKYLKKGYIHLDLRFWFPERLNEIRNILENKLVRTSNGKDHYHAFTPFIKILLKTPRYKYQEALSKYKLETKIRPISFASHIDSLIYSFHSFVLSSKYESYIKKNKFDECVLAYRRDLDGLSNIQFSKEVFDHVKNRKVCSAVALDIKGYFDSINHRILKQKWCEVIGSKLPEDEFRIFKSLTQYSYIKRDSILKKYNHSSSDKLPETYLDLVPGKKTHKKYQRLRDDKLIVTNDQRGNVFDEPVGIPQGSGMSAVLSNIFLIDFDKEIFKKSQDENFIYRRYCDDILIICSNEQAISLQNFLIQKIKSEYDLTIQERKVELIEFNYNSKGQIRAYNKKRIINDSVSYPYTDRYYKPLQYLGFEFNGKDILIRPSSLSRYFRKMKRRIVKTVAMAYSNNSKGTKIWKEQIFHRYSHLGKRNFISYALTASKESYTNSKGQIKVGMNSNAIKRQLSRHFSILVKSIEEKSQQRYKYKTRKGYSPFKRD